MIEQSRFLPLMLAAALCVTFGVAHAGATGASGKGGQQAARPAKQQNRNSVLPSNVRR